MKKQNKKQKRKGDIPAKDVPPCNIPRDSNYNEASQKPLSVEAVADIDKLLNSLFSQHLARYAEADIETERLKREYKDNMEQLLPILCEFLNNYIVIGHDLIGNEVSFMYAKDQNDKNAVFKLFNDTFIKMVTSQQRD